MDRKMIDHKVKEQLKAWWNNEDTGRSGFIMSILEHPENVPQTEDIRKYCFDADYKMWQLIKKNSF